MNLISQRSFQTRALTALFFVAVMLAGLFWNAWSFFILFSIIHFGCWHEFLQLLEKIHQTKFSGYVRLGFALLGYSLVLIFAGDEYQLAGYGLRSSLAFPVSIAGFALSVIGIFTGNTKLKAYAAAAVGWLYISLSWALFMNLYVSNNDFHMGDTYYVLPNYFAPAIIIAGIWVNDTMAYITGSLIGKTPLTSISPKKTWEGTIGGIILSILAVGGIVPFIVLGAFEKHFALFLLLLTLVVAITGTIGDLLESWLKRRAGVKDSGQFLPGHGGFLDRFDSMLLAIPFAWLLIRFLFSVNVTVS